MNRKNAGYIIRSNDLKLFNYLFKVKVALIEQINRDVYKYEKNKALYARINLFTRQQYLNTVADACSFGKKIVSLAPKGYKKFIAKGDERRNQLSSNKISHDLDLVDIRYLFKKSPRILEYITENSLLSCNYLVENEDIKPFIDKQPDAVILAKFSTGTAYLAVEYEATLKEITRYRELFTRYYLSDEVPAVIYLCKTKEIMNSLIKIEKKLFLKFKSKFFYKTLDEFKENFFLKFKNRNNEILSIGGAV